MILCFIKRSLRLTKQYSARSFPERYQEILNIQTKKTIDTLRSGSLNIQYAGIVVDFGYCKDAVLAKLIGEHLGAKVDISVDLLNLRS